MITRPTKSISMAYSLLLLPVALLVWQQVLIKLSKSDSTFMFHTDISFSQRSVQPSSPLTLPTTTPTSDPSLIKRADLPESFMVNHETLKILPWKDRDVYNQISIKQVTSTPLGSHNVQWLPDEQNLAVEIVTELDNKSIRQSVLAITPRGIPGGWISDIRLENECLPTYSWRGTRELIAFVHEEQLWLSSPHGYDQIAVDLKEHSSTVVAVQFALNDIMLLVLIKDGAGTGAEFNLLLFNMDTNEVVHRLNNVGIGTVSWSRNGDSLAYLGRVNRTDENVFGTLRLSLIMLSTYESRQIDVAPLLGSDRCLRKPDWIMNDQKLLLHTSSRSRPIIVDIAGKTMSLSEHLKESFGNQLESIDDLRACPNTNASPSGQYLLLSTDTNHIVGLDLINHTIVYQAVGNLCTGDIKITWHPSDAQFLSWSTEKPLILVNLTSNGSRTIDNSGLWPAWSPGGRIAYWKKEDTGYGLWLFDFTNGQSKQLTSASWHIPSSQSIVDMTPKWSPNGSSLAFVSTQNEFGQPEAFMLEYLPHEIIETKLNCERKGEFFQCYDPQIKIDFSYPVRFGEYLYGVLGGGTCGGYAYAYVFDNRSEAPLTGGRSWNYCEPRGGSITDFMGYVTIDKRGVVPYDPCITSWKIVMCEKLQNGVVLITYLTSHEIACGGYMGHISPWQSVAFDLPEDRKIRGFKFVFRFLSTKAEDELYRPLGGINVEQSKCADIVNQVAFDTSIERLAEQIHNQTVDEETLYQLAQIRRFADSIVIQ